MVTIETKAMGEVSVSEKQKVEFPDGILGFDFIREYYLLDMDEGPFYLLQAASDRDIAFVLIRPEVFMEEYDFRVSSDDLGALQIDDPDDVLEFVIVTIPENPEQMTANMQGPIIINRNTRKARQIISMNDNYSTKHLILPGIQARNEGGD